MAVSDYFDRSLFDALPDVVLLVDEQDLTVVDINQRAIDQYGWGRELLIGMNIWELARGKEHPGLKQARNDRIKGKVFRFDHRIEMADGTWKNFNFAGHSVGGGHGRFVLVGRETEAFATAWTQLLDLHKLADLTDDLFVVTDRDGFMTYANNAAILLHGAPDYVGLHVTEFIHEDDDGFVEMTEAAMRAAGKKSEARVLSKRADGSPITMGCRTVFDKKSQRWFTVERDISDIVAQEKRMQRLAADLREQATTDPLTGIANRHALNEALEAAVAQNQPFALLLLDMDDFKSVNDSLGHAAGDAFLCGVAQRICDTVAPTDLVARLGGDEFVALLGNTDREAAVAIAEKMIDRVGQPYSLEGAVIHRSCSIGVSISREGDEASSVLLRADRAAYRAKHDGRSRYALFDSPPSSDPSSR